MTMEVEIISRENIKPSSQTPHHLKIYELSLLDQIIPPVSYPVILYFPANDHNPSTNIISNKTHLLKQSLSQCLTRFYPFAGVISDCLSVDCNDEGVPFVVAKVKGCLSNFLEQPDLKLIQIFLPCAFSWDEKAQGSNVVMIQLNFFDCGGLVIAINVSHNVADGITLCTFLKQWGLIAQGCKFNQEMCPNFMGQSLFPQISSLSEEKHLFSDIKQFLKVAKYIPRRYVFNALAISKLKDELSVESPTRVEVVSAFIWKCFMSAKSCSPSSTFLLTHAVNLRRKTSPPLPVNCFGNFLWIAAAQSSDDNEADLTTLATKIRQSIREVDDDFVKNMQGEKVCIGYYENLERTSRRIPKEAEILSFSSWCNFGIYDIDFGWGRPMWASNCVPAYAESLLFNSVTLMDTRLWDGVEALVILEEKCAVEFEKNQELQSYACIDPSPLAQEKK